MKEIFFFVGLGLGTLCICQRCHLIGFTIAPRRSHRQQYINASCRLHRRSDVKSHGGVTDLASQVTVGYLYFLGLWFKKFQACGEVENGAVNTGRPSRLHMGLIHTSSMGWGAPFFTTQGLLHTEVQWTLGGPSPPLVGTFSPWHANQPLSLLHSCYSACWTWGQCHRSRSF